VGDPRDPVDGWLNADVEPLAPPPGTFERIRHRARRRKAARAAASVAGVLVVVAAGATIPVVTGILRGQAGHASRPVAEAPAPTVPASPRPSVSGGGTPNARSSSTVPPSSSALSAAGSGEPVPPNFQPTSVTFVGTHIGAVIGQAGTPGHCATAYCTSLAGTSDYGSNWYGVSAPVTGPPDGATGVGQIRFLNTSDGWAFGPQLWVTHDGGAHWSQEDTRGMRVTDLETAGDRAFALFATCTGGGAGYAAGCSTFSLYTSGAGSDRWQPVPGPVSGLSPPKGAAGQAASASLVLAGGTGYLLAPSGELLSGPLTGSRWAVASQKPLCPPGSPSPDGQPTGALLAAAAPAELVLVCTSATDTASDSQEKLVTESSDGGRTWSKAGNGPTGGVATSLATQDRGALIVLATDAGIYQSGTGGSSWALRQAGPGGAAAGEGGFSYVGMTSLLDGVALPADPGLHEVFITTDGGGSWRPHAVSRP
jgi:hypothetical protein